MERKGEEKTDGLTNLPNHALTSARPYAQTAPLSRQPFGKLRVPSEVEGQMMCYCEPLYTFVLNPCPHTARSSRVRQMQGQSPEKTGAYTEVCEDFRRAITQPEGFLAQREIDYPLVEAALIEKGRTAFALPLRFTRRVQMRGSIEEPTGGVYGHTSRIGDDWVRSRWSVIVNRIKRKAPKG